MKTTKIKTGIIALTLLGCAAQSFAQDRTKVIYKAELKKQDVPFTIIENVKGDFPDFTLDEIYAIPVEYVLDDVIVDTPINSKDDYSTYQLVLRDKTHEIKAIYNADGKLVFTEEHDENITPPIAVRNSIVKAFPGWTITKDNYKMTHLIGNIQKERYKMILEKGNERKKVYLDASGDILQEH